MRASKLAQVRLNSVRTERGVLVIAFEEKAKKLGSKRLIPVHSKVLGAWIRRKRGPASQGEGNASIRVMES
jgi:hypothetical protein